MGDAQLLERFLSRGEATAERAFASLVERHGAAVTRVCIDVLGDHHEAQDAAQAVFLVLARRARSIRKPGSLGPWLHGVALRVARRARVEAMRRREAERRAAEQSARRGDAGRVEEAPHDFELHEEIDRLPEKYRAPIILCDLQGQTQEQAARELGWPYGTVQTRLFRGRKRLRDRLTRRGVGLVGVVGTGALFPLFESPALAVSPDWAEATAHAAVRFASGQEVGGGVSPSVTRLAGSSLRAIRRESLKALAILGLLVCASSLGIGLVVVDESGGKKARGSAMPSRKTTGPELASGRETGAPVAGARPEPVSRKTAVVAESPARAPVASIETRPEVEPASALPPSRYVVVDRGRMMRKVPDVERQGDPVAAEFPPGRELFERVWLPDDPRSHGGDGLGPVFNARSCVDCHDQGGPGGSGASSMNIEIATADVGSSGAGFGFSYAFGMDFGPGGFSYQFSNNAPTGARRSSPDPAVLAAIHPGFRQSRSLVLHRFGTDRTYQAWREAVPGPHGVVVVSTSQRNPTPLFGTGLIDRIPDEAIVAASKKPPGSTHIRGRVSRLEGGRVGKFGWKAQTATLEEFVLSAAAGEMGLEVSKRPQAADPRFPGARASGLDMDEAECNALVAYVRSLPPPVVRSPVDEKDAVAVKAGASTFKTIGCAGCHLPKLGDVEGIYSDLLLHEMSPKLADTGQYGIFVTPAAVANRAEEVDARGRTIGAAVQEWRTPPLWGLRDSAPYLHDGRALTVGQAILLHGGQGASSAERYARLSPRRKQQLEAFLLSLQAPPQDVRSGEARAD